MALSCYHDAHSASSLHACSFLHLHSSAKSLMYLFSTGHSFAAVFNTWFTTLIQMLRVTIFYPKIVPFTIYGYIKIENQIQNFVLNLHFNLITLHQIYLQMVFQDIKAIFWMSINQLRLGGIVRHMCRYWPFKISDTGFFLLFCVGGYYQNSLSLTIVLLYTKPLYSISVHNPIQHSNAQPR